MHVRCWLIARSVAPHTAVLCHAPTHALTLSAGDGAGVGKGRTIAGLILENWRHGRHKHLWLSVGSDLKIDSQRDLNDVGGGCGL